MRLRLAPEKKVNKIIFQAEALTSICGCTPPTQYSIKLNYLAREQISGYIHLSHKGEEGKNIQGGQAQMFLCPETTV